MFFLLLQALIESWLGEFFLNSNNSASSSQVVCFGFYDQDGKYILTEDDFKKSPFFVRNEVLEAELREKEVRMSNSLRYRYNINEKGFLSFIYSSDITKLLHSQKGIIRQFDQFIYNRSENSKCSDYISDERLVYDPKIKRQRWVHYSEVYKYIFDKNALIRNMPADLIERLSNKAKRSVDKYLLSISTVSNVPTVIENSNVSNVPTIIENLNVSNVPTVIENSNVSNVPTIIENSNVLNVPTIIENLNVSNVSNVPTIIENSNVLNVPTVIENLNVSNVPTVLQPSDSLKSINTVIKFKCPDLMYVEDYIFYDLGYDAKVYRRLFSKFKCPDLMYVENYIFCDLGWDDKSQLKFLNTCFDNDIKKDVIKLSRFMIEANKNIKKGAMLYDDVVTFMMHPEHLELIGKWVDNYLIKNGGYHDNFITELLDFVSSLGYSDLYTMTTVRNIVKELEAIRNS